MKFLCEIMCLLNLNLRRHIECWGDIRKQFATVFNKLQKMNDEHKIRQRKLKRNNKKDKHSKNCKRNWGKNWYVTSWTVTAHGKKKEDYFNIYLFKSNVFSMFSLVFSFKKIFCNVFLIFISRFYFYRQCFNYFAFLQCL